MTLVFTICQVMYGSGVKRAQEIKSKMRFALEIITPNGFLVGVGPTGRARLLIEESQPGGASGVVLAQS